MAAIDAAGAKGPPVTLGSLKEHLIKLVRREWLITDFFAILALFLLFGYFYWIDRMGTQMFAAKGVVDGFNNGYDAQWRSASEIS